MKHIVTLALVLLPLLTMGQTTRPTEKQCAQRIVKLQKLLERYDARYDYFNYLPRLDRIIVTSDYRKGLIDLDGRVLLPTEYLIQPLYGTSNFLVFNTENVGLINKDAHWLVPMEYDNVYDCVECMDKFTDFDNGTAYVRKDGKYGLVDTSGHIIVPFIYETPFSVDLEYRMFFFYDYESEKPQEWATDFDGKLLFGPYEELETFSDGLAKFKQDGKVGFLDPKGKVTIARKYDFALRFDGGSCIAGIGDDIILIDKHGKEKFRFAQGTYCEYSLWHNTLFVTNRTEGTAYGVVDASGKEIIPGRYNWWAKVNESHLAMFDADNECDIYDRQGRLVTHFKGLFSVYLEEYTSYNAKYFPALKETLWGAVDTNFNTVLPFRYKEVYYLGCGFFKVVDSDGRTSYVDISGKPVVDELYEEVSVVDDWLFKFLNVNPDDYDDMIVGYVDIYGHTTATAAQIAQMRAWKQKRR